MQDANSLIAKAFENLREFPGFVERPDQRQLAQLISDCIYEGKSGVFEAPTGLGKSLAALVPAIAHAIASGKRTVIATYTNVLAEQYWRKDLPTAMRLFDEAVQPKAQFLIGRQRYACQAQMAELPRDSTQEFRARAELGIESEFREHSRKIGREAVELWQKVSAPPVCPARLCPHYQDCYYYKARRSAERAQLIITNHSVVLSDALLSKASKGELSLLGDYDFLVIDEAHDLPQAALNALEFQLSEGKLATISGIAQRLHTSLQVLALEAGQPHIWQDLCENFRQCIAAEQNQVKSHGAALGQGIVKATPADVWNHPHVQSRTLPEAAPVGEKIALEVAEMTLQFVQGIEATLKDWRHEGAISATEAEDASDTIRNYVMFLLEFAYGCQQLFAESTAEQEAGVGVTYVSSGDHGVTQFRHDVIGLDAPLRELIWNRVPSASLSATLAVDGSFEFYRRMTGARPDFEEILPSPFDFSSQAALYLPRAGAIPDPAESRKSQTEDAYYESLARELSQIIREVRGRTLALFHSRKEMEGVFHRMDLPDSLPLYMQRGSSAAWVGERFKKEVASSLFAVRSFWTGFDAPGETLSCVALVRIPFEVPVDPPQIARMAWLQTLGMEPFSAYSLPQAKMMVRQGAGRLIRTAEDVGLIALLDPRVRTKGYGSAILENLPAGLRTYGDIGEAAAAVGLGALAV